MHLDAFVNDALAGERSVSVDDDRNDRIPLVVGDEVLLSTGSAHHDRVDCLKVRGIGQQGDLDWNFIWAMSSIKSRAKVVLDVTRTCKTICVSVGNSALEFRENDILGLLDHVGEAVKSSSVGHADDECPGSVFRGLVHAELEARDESLAALNSEALHRVELLGHKVGEGVGLVDALVKLQFFFFGEGVKLEGLKL